MRLTGPQRLDLLLAEQKPRRGQHGHHGLRDAGFESAARLGEMLLAIVARRFHGPFVHRPAEGPGGKAA